MAISRSQLVKELEPGLNALFGMATLQQKLRELESTLMTLTKHTLLVIRMKPSLWLSH